MLTSICESLTLFFFYLYALKTNMLSSNGYNTDLWSFSVSYFTGIMIVVELKIAMHTRYWVELSWLFLLPFSICLYVLYFFVSNWIFLGYVQGVAMMLIYSFTFFGTCILGIGLMFVIDLTILLIERSGRTWELVDRLRVYMKKAEKF